MLTTTKFKEEFEKIIEGLYASNLEDTSSIQQYTAFCGFVFFLILFIFSVGFYVFG